MGLSWLYRHVAFSIGWLHENDQRNAWNVLAVLISWTGLHDEDGTRASIQLKMKSLK